MFRIEQCISSVMAVAIMTACGSSVPAGSDESKTLNLQGTSTASPPPPSGPPPFGRIGELVPVEAATISADEAIAALADRKVQSSLLDLALRVSADAGVLQPGKVIAVAAADHQVAETLVSGAIINDHAPVYVLKITGGRFTARHHPSDAPAPQGEVLTITVDAATLRVTDLGIDDVDLDLNALGHAVDLSSP